MAAHKTDEKKVQEPEMAIQEDPGFTTDSTVHPTDSDAEKGHTEKVSQDATEAERLNELEVNGPQLYILMAAILLAAFAMAMNGTILGTALPAITAEFNTVDDVGCCAMSPFVGKLFKLFRMKLLFIIMMSVFLVGSLVGAQADSSDVLIISRMVAGIGGSGIMNGGQTIIAAVVPIAKRSAFNGIVLGTFALGQAVGPLIGGALTEHASWRWCFYFNFPLGGLVIFAFVFLIKLPIDSLCKEKLTLAQKIWRIDLIGFFIFCLAVTLFLLGLQWGGSKYEWSNPRVVGTMVVGLVGFGVLGMWLWWRGEKALIPPRLLNDRINIMITITSFVQSGATVTSLYWLPIWFQSIQRASPFDSGILILPMILSQLIFSILCGVLVQKTGYYLPEVIGGNIMVAIGAGLTSTFTPDTTIGEQIGFQVLLGAGRGLVLQLLVTAMQANVPRDDASVASAYCMFSQFLGSAIFSSLAKTIFTSSLPGTVAKYASFLKDGSVLVNMGATQLPDYFRGAQLDAVMDAYNAAIVNVYYLQLAAALGAFCTGWGMGWKNLKILRQERLTDDNTPAETLSGSSEVADDNRSITASNNNNRTTDNSIHNEEGITSADTTSRNNAQAQGEGRSS
ncbi:hypothetical protein DL769_005894 [Monosporascus sp. CRB-8-3]|nr:hypothetical protein DL769_005894 [Monosporascus sp. CRB-8-3]